MDSATTRKGENLSTTHSEPSSSTRRLFALFSRLAGVPVCYDDRASGKGRAVAEYLFSERPYNATTFVVDEGDGYHLLAGREWGRSRFLAGIFLPSDSKKEVWVYKSGFLETTAGGRRNFNLRLNYQTIEGGLNLQEVVLTRTRFRKPPLRIYIDATTPEDAALVCRGRRIASLKYKMVGNEIQLSGEALDRFLGMGGPIVSQATVTLPNVDRLPPSGCVRAMRLLQRTVSGAVFSTKARFGSPIGWTEAALRSKTMPGVAAVMAIGVATLFFSSSSA